MKQFSTVVSFEHESDGLQQLHTHAEKQFVLVGGHEIEKLRSNIENVTGSVVRILFVIVELTLCQTPFL